jgi:hypothetical protein
VFRGFLRRVGAAGLGSGRALPLTCEFDRAGNVWTAEAVERAVPAFVVGAAREVDLRRGRRGCVLEACRIRLWDFGAPSAADDIGAVVGGPAQGVGLVADLCAFAPVGSIVGAALRRHMGPARAVVHYHRPRLPGLRLPAEPADELRQLLLDRVEFPARHSLPGQRLNLTQQLRVVRRQRSTLDRRAEESRCGGRREE